MAEIVKNTVQHHVESKKNYHITFKTDLKGSRFQLRILEDLEYGDIDIIEDAYEFEYYNDNNCVLSFEISYYIKINDDLELDKDKDIDKDKELPFSLEVVPKTLRINQIYMNKILKIAFLEDLKRYNLVEYHNKFDPSIFYGIMHDEDFAIFKENKSLRVIVWIGGDINSTIVSNPAAYKRISAIQKMKNVKHICISRFIRTSLTRFGLPYTFMPFMGVNFELYKPVVKGPSIYLYTTLVSESYYGSALYTRVMEKYKEINFIVTCCKFYWDMLKSKNNPPYKYNIQYYEKSELIEKIYPQCFIGLRLTDHDGLAGSVQELGLLGIKSIHNGESPSAVNYSSFEDICAIIEREYKTVGTMDTELAHSVKNYLTIKEDFFYV